jgi:hypothetical protein
MEWRGLVGPGFLLLLLIIIFFWNRISTFRDQKREDAEMIAVMDEFREDDAFENDDLY